MIETGNRHERRRAAKFERIERDDGDQGGDPALDGAATRAYVGGITEMTRWRWERAHQFPKPDLVVGRRNFWRRSTLDAWLSKCSSGQDDPWRRAQRGEITPQKNDGTSHKAPPKRQTSATTVGLRHSPLGGINAHHCDQRRRRFAQAFCSSRRGGPVTDPYVIHHWAFPPQLHDATCWWQFSSSQGVFADETLSAHLWFWSTAPSNDDGAYPLGNGSKPDPRPQTYRPGAVPHRAGTLRRQTDLLQP